VQPVGGGVVTGGGAVVVPVLAVGGTQPPFTQTQVDTGCTDVHPPGVVGGGGVVVVPVPVAAPRTAALPPLVVAVATIWSAIWTNLRENEMSQCGASVRAVVRG
jgi:hypothetical protein